MNFTHGEETKDANNNTQTETVQVINNSFKFEDNNMQINEVN